MTALSPSPHVKNRVFVDWINTHQPNWVLMNTIVNPYHQNDDNPDETSEADFYFFERQDSQSLR